MVQPIKNGTIWKLSTTLPNEESTDLLRYLESNGLIPGNQFFIPDASPAYGITLRRCNHDITLSAELATILWGTSTPIEAVLRK